MASVLSLEFIDSGIETRILYRGNDCSIAIRSEACGVAASKIAVYASVRSELLSCQRNFAVLPGLIADGRDMVTVVFPCLFYTILLTASLNTTRFFLFHSGKPRYPYLYPITYTANLTHVTLPDHLSPFLLSKQYF